MQSGENTLPACFPHSFLVDAPSFSAITRFPPIMNRIQWSENTCACKCANNKRLTQALGNYSMKNGVKKRNYSIKPTSYWGIIPFPRCQMLVVCYPLGLDRKRRLNVCQRRSLSLRFVSSCSVCRFLLSIDIMSLEISVSLPTVG